MQPVRALVIGVLIGWAQGSLEKTWSFGGPAPDLLLLYLIWLGLLGRTGTALWVAFLGGLVQDSVTQIDPLGVHSLGRVFVAYLPEWGKLVLVSNLRLSGIVLVMVGTLLQGMLLLSIRQTLQSDNLWEVGILLTWLISIMINTGIWIVIAIAVLPENKRAYSP